MRKILVAALATAVLGAPGMASADGHVTPKQLECENIKRTYDARIRDLKIHLEREMPPEIVLEEIRLMHLPLAPLGGIRGFDGVFHESSAQAYRDEIQEMLRRGKNRECPWAAS